MESLRSDSLKLTNRWFEDYEPGSVHEFGSIRGDEEEVLAFGRRFDPQGFHTDSQAVARTVCGDRVASGWAVALKAIQSIL